LLSFANGNTGAEILVRRDDGYEASLPIAHFFRPSDEFTPIENAALDRCIEPVLDVGAGAGAHSRALQERGLQVTALDISPEVVSVMKQLGVREVRQGDIFQFNETTYPTLLMLDHGLGLVGTVGGLRRFLNHTKALIREAGQILFDSIDVRQTKGKDPVHIAYQEANRRSGRYAGETRIQMTFEGVTGPYFGWLHIDPDSLADLAGPLGWRLEVLMHGDDGDYLGRLVRQPQ